MLEIGITVDQLVEKEINILCDSVNNFKLNSAHQDWVLWNHLVISLNYSAVLIAYPLNFSLVIMAKVEPKCRYFEMQLFQKV